MAPMTRRGFLIGACAVVVSAGVGAAVSAVPAEADVLRPPGAGQENDFMALCIRCERCISICPTDILEPQGIEGGVLQVRTPVVSFADDRCTYCEKCFEVCPTGAIKQTDPFQPDLGRIGVAEIIPDRCLAFIDQGSCGVCVEKCPYDAISFDESRRPVIAEAMCNGCGTCVKECPANVLTSFSGGSSRGVVVVSEETFLAQGGEA